MCLKAAMDAGEPVELESIDTFVDGAAVRKAGEIPFAVAKAHDLEFIKKNEHLLGEAAPEVFGRLEDEAAEIGLALDGEREFEVLRMLDTHLSSTEIAKALYISPNTVRFHIKNIYGKLDVHRRSDAVDRARSLGLL